jgi:redox-sensitive bicupin YhaK (pirin superfamily)
MMQIIRSGDRYHFERDWLSTYWHFSFDHYRDPANVHFGPLRVFNDDVIRPGGGFPMHGHREMEILTYVLEGRLEHRDSMGNTGVIGPGEVQRMTAGTGVEHSEYNASKSEPVHLLQFWILPAAKGLAPSWEQLRFTAAERRGKLLPVAVPVDSPGGAKAVRIHQDATVYASELAPGETVQHALAAGRRAYVFVISGELVVNGEALRAGDQARISDERGLRIAASQPAHFLLIDLP